MSPVVKHIFSFCLMGKQVHQPDVLDFIKEVNIVGEVDIFFQ